MKKTFYIALCAAGVGALTSCDDFLETSSKSQVDSEFVFANMETALAAMDGAYSEWHSAISSQIFGDGLYYALDVAGSDIMRHPEKYENQPLRHVPEAFYLNGTAAATYDPVGYGKEAPNSPYSVLFSVIGKANAVASSIESTEGYEEMMAQTEATDLSELYGEAIALRATAYRELIKYYGDIPYTGSNGLVSRDSIYDVLIADLKRVEPIMRPVDTDKRFFSQTYVDALIGRICLEAGGYQTRREDIRRVDGNGNELSIEPKGKPNNGAIYGRRSDWKDLYATAKEYFQKAIDHQGTAKFAETYYEFFSDLHGADASYAGESIYEEPFQQGGDGNDPRPYSLGRPSAGGGSNAYPCKNYGQGRINPAFYYGVFDPNDLRRDLACAVTGSDGKGYEKLIPFAPGSTANGGGIACNKFDESRQNIVNTAAQRKSGINAPYMRMTEVYLGLAEAAAALGDDATAKQYLTAVRDRAFGGAGKGNVDAFIAKEEGILNAVIAERGFEFAGEGDRRFTLIRTGLIGEKIRAIKELTKKMIDGLKSDGYYVFENGNVISDSIYTKLVDPTEFGFARLTEETPAILDGLSYDQVGMLVPGWRGQKDFYAEKKARYTGFNWQKYTETKNWEMPVDSTTSNLSIHGLFERLDEYQVAALIEDGYEATAWGAQIVANEDEYYKYLFYEYDYESAPIYLFPFSPNAMATGGFTNGYGFVNNE